MMKCKGAGQVRGAAQLAEYLCSMNKALGMLLRTTGTQSGDTGRSRRIKVQSYDST